MSHILRSYSDAVRFLYSLGNESKAARLGLERICLLLERLGSPHRACRFVHVAGTNGKGSVCAMLESALRAAGMRTGLFTSPHLVEPTERIQVDGQPVSRELFAWAFMAFLLLEDLAAQTVALEVGLGGRLDATNVVLPRVSVITPIDYDHEAFLGRSVEAIAGEKAGIIKPGVPVVIGPQRPSVDELLAARAADEESQMDPRPTTGYWPTSRY
jgi:dihydrofolate synthase/folylpolyglutamate synthase